MIVVKKYSNRRLYDTEDSRYITLEELATKIRRGTDVEVVDAKTGADLTQATLTQLILEGPAAKLLPVPLLHQLIRMQDDALAEFFSKYVSAALELYVAAKDGVSMFPFASMPMQATSAFMRLFTSRGSNEVDALRREVADLREELRKTKSGT
jgi:polyhydroxyalkanoate synthesis repressor PhaR